MRTNIFIFLLFLTGFSGFRAVLYAQSSKKPSHKSASPSNFNSHYQDLVSRNNYYFNANLIIDESIKKIKSTYKDDYQEILRVTPFEGGEQATAVSGEMDKVITKANKDIKKHSDSKWVDNEYINIGKAYYLKGDKEKAAEAFRYVIKVFGERTRMIKKSGKSKSAAKTKKSPSASKSAKSSYNSGTMSAEERAKARENEKLSKEKQDAKKAREKAIKKRNDNKAKLKKLNAKRQKKGQKPLTYKEKFGEDPYGIEPKTTEAVADSLALIPQPDDAKQKEEIANTDTAQDKEKSTAAIPEEELIFDSPVKINPKSSFGHKPSYYDGHLWLARTAQDSNKSAEALSILNSIAENKNFPRKKQAELYGLFAQCYINIQDYSKAAEYVDLSLDKTKKKNDKYRLFFIKAQLAERKNDTETAMTAYNKSRKAKFNYPLALNSELKILQLKLKQGKLTSEQVVAKMNDMKEDPKNAEYKDQILKTMSQLALDAGNVNDAINLLADAASANTNKEQKALAYLKLAELLYDQKDFITSGKYYDSTMANIAKSFPDYEKVKNRQIVLGELIEQLNIISAEDSLQRIALMRENERNAYLDKIIADFEKNIAQAKENASNANDHTNVGDAYIPQNTAFNTPGANQGGRWYFYNEEQKSQGYNDFMRRMGSRQQGDFWAVRAKASESGGQNAADQNNPISQDLQNMAAAGGLTREKLIAGLPLTPQQIVSSNNRIAKALFNAGNIYYTKLDNNPPAINALDRQLNAYPNSENEEQALYTIFLACKEENRMKEADQYKERLLKKYGDGIFANLLKDPHFAEKLIEKSLAAERFYELTYDMYNAKKYNEVLLRKKEAEVKFASNTTLRPRMDMLEALTIGHTKDKQAYVEALKGVVVNHKDHEVKTKAEEILKYLGENVGVIATTGTQESPATPSHDSAKSLYTRNDAITHYTVIYIGSSSEKQAKVMAAISDFNNEKYSLDKLKTKPMLLGSDQHIIYIQNFPNAAKAKSYFESIEANIDRIFTSTGKEGAEVFYMSKTNFTTFFGDKKLAPYLEFFKENY